MILVCCFVPSIGQRVSAEYAVRMASSWKGIFDRICSTRSWEIRQCSTFAMGTRDSPSRDSAPPPRTVLQARVRLQRARLLLDESNPWLRPRTITLPVGKKKVQTAEQ